LPNGSVDVGQQGIEFFTISSRRPLGPSLPGELRELVGPPARLNSLGDVVKLTIDVSAVSDKLLNERLLLGAGLY
jgi:hypothetical protein